MEAKNDFRISQIILLINELACLFIEMRHSGILHASKKNT
ncbi:hypothetical protein LMG33818_001917 [Halomonadaceae bacterium LMG 33818]